MNRDVAVRSSADYLCVTLSDVPSESKLLELVFFNALLSLKDIQRCHFITEVPNSDFAVVAGRDKQIGIFWTNSDLACIGRSAFKWLVLLHAVGAEVIEFDDTIFMTSQDDVVCCNRIHASYHFVVSENTLCNCKFIHVEHFELVVWATSQEVLVCDPAHALDTIWAFQIAADIHCADRSTLSLWCTINTILSTLPIIRVYLPALNSLVRILN